MIPSEKKNYFFDVVIIGEGNCGKDELIENFNNDDDRPFALDHTYTTTGVHSVQIGNNALYYQLGICTPSVDRYTVGYRTDLITDSLKQYPNPLAVIFVCDLTRVRGSFDVLNNYNNTVNQHPQDPSRPLKKILIGTRTDSADIDYVSESELRKFSDKNNMTYAGIINHKDKNSIDKFFESIILPETPEGKQHLALNKRKSLFMRKMLFSSLLLGLVGFLIPYFIGVGLLYSAILGSALCLSLATTCCCIHCKKESSITENAQSHESIALLEIGVVANPSRYEQSTDNNLTASDEDHANGENPVTEREDTDTSNFTFTEASNVARL